VYFFYIDESGSRDPSIGTPDKSKDHLYVLLAVGFFERQWRPFDQSIASVKLRMADRLWRTGHARFDLADCEVKSNWLRNAKEREARSRFLHALSDEEREELAAAYLDQLKPRNAVVIAAVIDKRHLQSHMTHETLHKKAYEFLLERIQQYMTEFHPKHQALIVMDDTSKQLNRAVAMKHAWFQRDGNQVVQFRNIVEYPFFTPSELSHGVQLADMLAYNVYRAFRTEDLAYPYYAALEPFIYRRRAGRILDGLKVWPEGSPLIGLARQHWKAKNKSAAPKGGR
jgi:hypothetical protein